MTSVPTYAGFQTALRGLQANQVALATTAENVANAANPTYSRQRVVLQATPALNAGVSAGGSAVQVGSGVGVSAVQRVRDGLLDIQYRSRNTAAAAAATTATLAGRAQAAFPEPSTTGLGSQLSSFWSAWNSLALQPGPAAAVGVVSAGQALAAGFAGVDGQLATVQSQAQQQYAALVGPDGEVQQRAREIGTLNTQIARATADGQAANDLLDARDAALDDLSALAAVTVTPQRDGTVTVEFGDAAAPLVQGGTATWPQTLSTQAGGQLGALLSASSETGSIGQLRSQLDDVAGAVIASVNSLQATGSPFFSGTSAATVAVSASADSVQAAAAAPDGVAAAQAIARLSGGSADGDYAGLVATVGAITTTAETTHARTAAVLGAVQWQRQSLSSVSLDEEMTNLVTYQQGYQASARVLNVLSKVLDTLINEIGSR